MGFELSVVAVIFFVSAVLMGAFSYTMMSSSDDMLRDASDDQYQMHQSRLKTDIEVVGSSSLISGSDYNLTVSLSNTGSETLYFDRMNILIDGNIVNYTYEDTASLWTPAQTRNFTVNSLSGLGMHRIKIVTENGVSAYDTYIV